LKSINIPIIESISLTDSVSEITNIAVPLEETLQVNETYELGKTVTQSLTESISLDDSMVKEVSIKLTESIELTDDSSTIKSKIILLTESILLTDSLSKDAIIKLSETISLADSVSKAVDKKLSESLQLVDFRPSAANGDITAVRTQSEGNNFEYDDDRGQFNSLVQVDSDTFALAYRGTDHDGFISTFNISSDGATITKVHTIEHDHEFAWDNSLIKVDSDTFALAYGGEKAGPSSRPQGMISTFTIDSDGTITPIRIANHAAFGSASANLIHDTNEGSINSLVHVNDDTYALSYERNHLFLQITTFTISSDGATITELDTLNQDATNCNDKTLQSLVKVDSDTVARAYCGTSGDGYLRTYSIAENGDITKKSTYEFDTSSGSNHFLVQVDSDTIAVAYQNAEVSGGMVTARNGVIKTFTINSSDEISEADSLEHHSGTNASTGNSEDNSLVKVDSDIFALAYDDGYGGNDGFISTFRIESDGNITGLSTKNQGDNLEHDTSYTSDRSLVKVDSNTVALAYGGTDADGFISTFTISTDNIEGLGVSKAVTISLTESIGLSDSTFGISAKSVTLSESISLIDHLKIKHSPKLSESIAFTDSVIVQRTPLVPTLRAFEGAGEAVLGWKNPVNPNVATITDHVIQRSLDNGKTWNRINDIGDVGETTAYTVGGLVNGQESMFRVKAVNSVGSGSFSDAVRVTPISDDGALIRNLTVIPGTEAFTAKWTADPARKTDIADLLVYYSNDGPDGPWILHDDGYGFAINSTIGEITTFKATFVKVLPVLKSLDNCPSPDDSQISWTLPERGPPQKIPTNDIFVFPEQNKVLIEWEIPMTGGAPIDRYDIRYKQVGGNFAPTMPIYPTVDEYGWYEWEITDLTANTEYKFQIRANNMAGNGDWSDSIQTETKNVQDLKGSNYIPANFDYDAEGVRYNDDHEFDGVKDFGSGQTFGDNTEFHAGQTFDDDVNFSGKNIKFNGANFQRAETFGDGAAFTGTQSFTGQNTFGDSTVFGSTQNFGSAVQTFGDGVKFGGNTDFANGQMFGKNTEFANGQRFESGEDYHFNATGLDFGSGTIFGGAEEFGTAADFSKGTMTFTGTNTFGYGTEFAAGQAFTTTQVFGQGVDFEDNMEFADNQVFAIDYDFNEPGLDFGAGTVFCGAEEIGAGADFDDGVVQFGGAMTFKSSPGSETKFAADQDFSDYVMDFAAGGEFEFYADGDDFAVGQDFDGDVEFKELFDYDDMYGKKFEFLGNDVHFMMPPDNDGDGLPDMALAIPPGTVFGDGFDYDDMFTDADGDGVNDEYYRFEPGVKFHADTRFPPMVEFADGFSKNDMLGKEFTFDEGVFFAGDPVFPAGQEIKPGVLWDEPPTFEVGVNINPGLALPAGTTFSPNLQLPAFVAAPYGLVLAPITCADTDCIPNEDSYLKPGELLPPGIDPPPVVNYITASNKTFTNPGLGFEMAFDQVAKAGKVNVDLKDPATVPATSPGSTEGKRAMTSGTGIFENVGSIIDVSVTSASATGAMTVTLPYDEKALGSATEDEIVLLHYTGGEWVTVSNITIDKENNKVTGIVDSLSPFTVGTQTGTVSTGGPATGAPGGAGGAGSPVPEGEQTAVYPPLNILEIMYDTDSNIVKVVVSPEYDRMDVMIRTSMGSSIATKIISDPVLNQATYQGQLLVESGPLQISAKAYEGPIVIEATPVLTAISAGSVIIQPKEERPGVITIAPKTITPPDEFQKPDEFITEKQCPIGTSLINGKCVQQTLQEQPLPIQFAVILLLVLLAIGLLLVISLRRRKRVEIVASQLLVKREEELIRPTPIPYTLPPSIVPPKLVEEESNLINLLQVLRAQEVIQKKLHLLETKLLEHVNEEVQIRERLTILLQIVEIRVHLIHPLLPQLKPLPAPRRTYKKKRKVLSDEHKAKIATARRGKRLAQETKLKIAESRTGRKMSDEHKAKIAASRKGKKQTEETKLKIAESRTGRKMSESTKQRISKSKKVRKDSVNEKSVELDELIRRYNIVSDEEYSDEL